MSNEIYFKLNGIIYQLLEISCVVIPSFLVCGLVYYSIFMLYAIRIMDVWGLLTLKVVGSQWYWHYEFSDLNSGVDCVITPLEDLSRTSLSRNFNTSPVLSLPVGVNIRGCLSSRDVIHRWSVPALGVKLDCNVGMLSIVTFKIPIVGVFVGGCREICGVGHSSIPIFIESSPFFCVRI